MTVLGNGWGLDSHSSPVRLAGLSSLSSERAVAGERNSPKLTGLLRDSWVSIQLCLIPELSA